VGWKIGSKRGQPRPGQIKRGKASGRHSKGGRKYTKTKGRESKSTLRRGRVQTDWEFNSPFDKKEERRLRKGIATANCEKAARKLNKEKKKKRVRNREGYPNALLVHRRNH